MLINHEIKKMEQKSLQGSLRFFHGDSDATRDDSFHKLNSWLKENQHSINEALTTKASMIHFPTENKDISYEIKTIGDKPILYVAGDAGIFAPPKEYRTKSWVRKGYILRHEQGRWQLTKSCVILKESRYSLLPDFLQLSNEEEQNATTLQDKMKLVFAKYTRFLIDHPELDKPERDFLENTIHTYFNKLNETEQIKALHPEVPHGYIDTATGHRKSLHTNRLNIEFREVLRTDVMRFIPGVEIFTDLDDPNGFIDTEDNSNEHVIFKLTVLRNLADALDMLHQQRKVHRDFKTENVRLTKDGDVGIFDFECIKDGVGIRECTSDLLYETIHESGKRYKFASRSGSVEYSSPERTDKDISGPPADMYAFGIISKECFNMYFTDVDAVEYAKGNVFEVMDNTDPMGGPIKSTVDEDGNYHAFNFKGETVKAWVSSIAFLDFDDKELGEKLKAYANSCMADDPLLRPTAAEAKAFLDTCLKELLSNNQNNDESETKRIEGQPRRV